MLIFAASKTNIWIMDIKKVTYEEALARFKRSLEIRRNAEKRMAEEWKAMGLKGTIVSL
jgi:ribose 5-phosphate isomerase